MIILIFIAIVIASVISALLSSAVNKGTCSWIWVVAAGFGVSLTWAIMTKYSTNLIRDGLIWDIIVAMIYCLVFVILGHAANFGLRHWIGVVATLAVFIYWSLIG